MIKRIVKYGEILLEQQSATLDQNTNNFNEIIRDLADSFNFYDIAIGLSAVQIGHPYQAFIAKINDNKRFFINPQIMWISESQSIQMEGCLSFPEIRIPKTRPRQITISYFDEDLRYHEEAFDNFNARVVLHEYEHCQGVLFNREVSITQKEIIETKIKRLKKENKWNIDEQMIQVIQRGIAH